MPKLRITEPNRQRDLTIDEEEAPLDLGRGDRCDIVLTGNRCSRMHARLEVLDGKWKLVDLESQNGSKVNGEFTNQSFLKPGDQITLADVEILFEPDHGASSDDQKNPPKVEKKKKKPEKRKNYTKSRRTSSSVTGVVIFALVLAAGVLYLFWTTRDKPKKDRPSKIAFRKGTTFLENRKYNKAIQQFKKVSVIHHPDLYERARKKIKKAKQKRLQDNLQQSLSRANSKLDKIKAKFEKEPGSPFEIRRAFSSLRREMYRSFNYRMMETNSYRELIKKTFSMENKLMAHSMSSPEDTWKQTKGMIGKLLENNEYGKAAVEIHRLRFIYPNRIQNMKPAEKRIIAAAKKHVNDLLRALSEKEPSRSSVKKLQSLLTKLQSTHPEIDALYENILQKVITKKQNLD